MIRAKLAVQVRAAAAPSSTASGDQQPGHVDDHEPRRGRQRAEAGEHRAAPAEGRSRPVRRVA